MWFLPCNVQTTRPSKKWNYKEMGLFKIMKKVGTSCYKLDLPASMTIDITFHISLLEPYEDNKFPTGTQTPPPPIKIAEGPEYEIEEIINSHIHRSTSTVPSGKVTPQNTTSHGTPQNSWKMPASPGNNLTPCTPGNQE